VDQGYLIRRSPRRIDNEPNAHAIVPVDVNGSQVVYQPDGALGAVG
jgi:hypothetical protein